MGNYRMLGVSRNIMRKIMRSMKAAFTGLGTRTASLACASLLATCLYSAEAHAVTYGFSWFGDAGTQATDDVSGQLSVDVTDAGSGQALFTFHNTGSIASTIGEIYFDNGFVHDDILGDSVTGPLDSILSLNEGTGVDFTAGTGGTLPGWDTLDPDFAKPATLKATADSPAGLGKNGIDIGEQLGVLFSLISGTSFTDLIDAIEAGLGLKPGGDTTGTLRIGLHVKAIGTDGTSDSFIMTQSSNAPTVVPLPAALPLLGGALGLLGFLGRRRRQATTA